ncbi:MAG TPA: hypothetical protein PLY87_21305 [Planctomycetaceae bacterium]|nr:hypothetical protein [Planctomycetaceae bacterium]HQZ67647.1 hypothetical protein [Planctomycetaceae bacterium]HRA90541.1 hypothetical protein [Planctomycetaceae bacterium]
MQNPLAADEYLPFGIYEQTAPRAAVVLEASQPEVIKEWTMADFADLDSVARTKDPTAIAKGMASFVNARCNQCHVVAGQGVNLGPDLT